MQVNDAIAATALNVRTRWIYLYSSCPPPTNQCPRECECQGAAKKEEEEEEGNNEVDWSGGESEAVTVVADLALWHGRAVSLQELSLAARTSIRTFAYVTQPYSTHVASILSMH